MIGRSARFLLSLLLVAGSWSPSPAVSVRRWAPATPEAFATGTLDGLSVGDRGLVLAPVQETWWGPEPGVVWAVAVDSRGGVLAAVTEPPGVLRFEGPGEPEAWFAPEDDGLVTALASTSSGGALVGTSEPGRVVGLAGPGSGEVRWEGDSRYVWDLVEDSSGTLWIATGAPGQVLRVEGADAAVLWRPDDDPVRCLDRHPEGGVVAGTGTNGIVARVGSDGVFVLLDADEQEIVAVRVAGDGTVFALASSASLPAPSRSPSSAEPAGARTSTSENQREPQPRVTVTVTPGPAGAGTASAGSAETRSKGGGGALYRIDPDGDVVELWSSRTLVPYALELDGDDVLVGTGESGRILRVRPDGSEEVVLRTPSGRVTSLALADDGDLFAGGGSDARVSRIGRRTGTAGTFVSEPVDAGWIADWGEVSWTGHEVAKGSVTIEVRTGNTSDPDDSWSDWRTLEGAGAGRSVSTGARAARWLQLKLRIAAGRGGSSPRVTALEMFYRPRNRPPRIEQLAVEPPGVAWHRGPAQSGTRYGAVVLDDPVAEAARRSLNGSAGLGPIRKSYEPGVRTFTWSVRDPDGDPIRAFLAFRAEGDAIWFPVSGVIEDDFFSWDARAVPDGRYRVRLTVDDAPGNAVGEHGQDERESDPFVLDRTPPRLEVRRSIRDETDVIRVDATDPGGGIASLEYSLTGDEWLAVEPVDGVPDGPAESYVLELPRASRGGSRPLALRLTDRSGNVTGAWEVLGPDQ